MEPPRRLPRTLAVRPGLRRGGSRATQKAVYVLGTSLTALSKLARSREVVSDNDHVTAAAAAATCARGCGPSIAGKDALLRRA